MGIEFDGGEVGEDVFGGGEVVYGFEGGEVL